MPKLSDLPEAVSAWSLIGVTVRTRVETTEDGVSAPVASNPEWDRAQKKIQELQEALETAEVELSAGNKALKHLQASLEAAEAELKLVRAPKYCGYCDRGWRVLDGVDGAQHKNVYTGRLVPCKAKRVAA